MIFDNHDQHFLHNTIFSIAGNKVIHKPRQSCLRQECGISAVGTRLSGQETPVELGRLLGMVNFCHRCPCQEQDDLPSMDEVEAAKQCSTALLKRQYHINFEDGHFHRPWEVTLVWWSSDIYRTERHVILRLRPRTVVSIAIKDFQSFLEDHSFRLLTDHQPIICRAQFTEATSSCTKIFPYTLRKWVTSASVLVQVATETLIREIHHLISNFKLVF